MPINTLADILRENVAAQPDATALVLADRRLTWAELDARSRRVATSLKAAGVGPGSRVAFLDKNSVEYFEIVFGAAYLNAVTVAVNWRLAPPEMEYIVNDSDAPVLFVHSDFAEHVGAFRGGLTTAATIVALGEAIPDTEPYEGWLGDPLAAGDEAPAGPDDVAIQLYTSGTTGLPKGAQLTNHNLTSLLDAAESWAMTADSVSLAAMPLFHIGGSGWALFGMSNGAATVLMRDLDPGSLLQLITSERISHAFLVPAVLQFLLLMPTDDVDLSSMELIAYGASPITEEVLVGSMGQFGCDFIQLYGLTETTGAVTQLNPEDHDPGGPRAGLLRSAGSPMPGITLKVVDPDTGESLPDGVVGEIWIQSPTNMKGYWKLPEATAESLPGDNWFRSGDAGYLEDGFLYIHDRVKDMIVSGGENVYPAEIENALMGHDGVADVAVIGVPDDRWGEVPKALVVKAESADPTEDELIAFSRERLAGFKCPKSVDFVEGIPRNPTGKILKRQLREPYWEGRDRNV